MMHSLPRKIRGKDGWSCPKYGKNAKMIDYESAITTAKWLISNQLEVHENAVIIYQGSINESGMDVAHMQTLKAIVHLN